MVKRWPRNQASLARARGEVAAEQVKELMVSISTMAVAKHFCKHRLFSSDILCCIYYIDILYIYISCYIKLQL